MRGKITFRSEVFIDGCNMDEITTKFDFMELFSEEAKKHGATFVEVTEIEEDNTCDETVKTTAIDEQNRKVSTYGLTEEQHKIAVKAVVENLRKVGNIRLSYVNEEVLEEWFENAEGDYKEFLAIGMDDAEEVMTLVDTSCGYEQVLGEVIVY